MIKMLLFSKEQHQNTKFIAMQQIVSLAYRKTFESFYKYYINTILYVLYNTILSYKY